MIIIAMVLVFGYVTLMCIALKQIPDSLSSTVFYLKPSQSWLWSVCMSVAALLTVPALIENSSENTKFLAFISVVAFLFTIGLPLLKNKDDMSSKAHTVACIIAILASQALIAVNYVWPLLLWVPYFGYQIYRTSSGGSWRTQVFWAEIVAFATVFLYAIMG